MTMHIRSRSLAATMGALCLALTACDPQPSATETDVPAALAAINLAPATLDEADVQFARLDALSKQSGRDPRVLAATRQLAKNVEPLNGLLDRITVGEGHSVAFYATGDTVSIAETGPVGTPAKVPPMLDRGFSVPDVFRTLAPDRQIPAALLGPAAYLPRAVSTDDVVSPRLELTPATLTPAAAADDDVTMVRSALVESDGPWYVDNVCPTTGLRWCQPNWGNGGGADSVNNYAASYLQIAPYAGDALNVRRIWNGRLQNTLTVFPGDFNFYSQHGPVDSDCSIFGTGCDFFYVRGRHKWELTNAAQDFFHWSGNFVNETIPPGR